MRLESVVGRLLIKRGQTLCLAESCTGGLIAAKITSIAGSSKYFLEGIVAYSNTSKTRLLGVQRGTLSRYGAVSELTDIEMARGVLKHSGSDWAVSVTGIAGPSGGTKEKPVGTVCIGIASKKNALARAFTQKFSGDRDQIRNLAARSALDILRRSLTFSSGECRSR